MEEVVQQYREIRLKYSDHLRDNEKKLIFPSHFTEMQKLTMLSIKRMDDTAYKMEAEMKALKLKGICGMKEPEDARVLLSMFLNEKDMYYFAVSNHNNAAINLILRCFPNANQYW